MKVYTTDKIRNIVLLGHGGAGKTTLAVLSAILLRKSRREGSLSRHLLFP